MQIGIDSFAAAYTETSLSPADRVRELPAEIEHADQVGLDVFGIGEHHRREYLLFLPDRPAEARETLDTGINLASFMRSAKAGMR